MAVTKLSLAFDKLSNGIFNKPGHAISEDGRTSWDDLYKYATIKDLYHEKNTGMLMLEPLIDFTIYGGMYANWVSGAGTKWENYLHTIIVGDTPVTMKFYHQFDSENEEWYAREADLLKENQGFIFSYMRNVDSANNSIVIKIGGILTIKIRKKKSFQVFYDGDSDDDMIGEGNPVEHFAEDNSGMRHNFMVCFFCDKYVIIGFNGIKETFAFAIPEDKYSYKEHGDYTYPIIIPDDSEVRIESGGELFIAFSQLYYKKTGSILSYYLMPSYQPATIHKETRNLLYDPLEEVAVQVQAPLNTVGSGANYKYRYKLVLTGVTYGTSLADYVGITPYVYGWSVYEDETFESPAGDAETLTTDVISYVQRMGDDGFGRFIPSQNEITIECYETIYNQIEAKNYEMTVNLGIDGEAYEQMGVFFTDFVTIRRSDFNVIKMNIVSRDVIKRCQNSMVFQTKELDGLRHGEMMDKLAKQAKVTLNKDSDADDPKFPLKEDARPANWKFSRGANIWESMQLVRQFSGWLLYPDSSGELQYRKRKKKSATSLKYTFSTEKDLGGNYPISNIRYTEQDKYRTRIIVQGIASEDSEKHKNQNLKWPWNGEVYKKGNLIVAMYINSALEQELGESRGGFYIDPALGSYASVAWACNNIAKYYTKKHTKISFHVPYAEDILDLWVYDKIRVIDSKAGKTDYYQVVGISIVATKMNISMNIDANSFVA